MKSGRWIVRAALVVLALAAGELALRVVLFTDVASGWSIAHKLRRPGLYADGHRSDLYWELQDRWLETPRPTVWYDSEVGWRGGWIQPETYEHNERPLLFDKRPILLFGDSYAQCNTEANECFQGLLESSGIGRSYHLLNFGVGGFGVDQVALLMPRVLDRYADLKPIVLVGVMVDDDIDRCRLSFRCWPKPRFELHGDELELTGVPVTRLEDYQRPFRGSMLVRLFVHGILPSSVSFKLERAAASDRAVSKLGEKLLERIIDDLQARKVDAMFLLFRTELSTANPPPPSDWRDSTVRRVLERRGMKWLDVGAAVHAAAGGGSVSKFFGGTPKLAGHYNALGNRVAFAAIVEALRRDFGVDVGLPPLLPASIAAKRVPGARSAALCERGAHPPFGSEDYERLSMVVDSGGPTEIDYDTAGGEAKFSATASLVPQAGVKAGSVELFVFGDGRKLAQMIVRRDEPRRAFSVDLHGVQRMTIRAADAGDGVEGDWLCLSLPRFE